MKNARGNILYIGKAGNLRRRVSSYFLRPHDHRIQKLVSEIKKIDYRETDSALEALILEAKLIKKYQPPYNVLEKDDTSFLYVEITNEEYPRVLLVRGKSRPEGTRYGPFVSATAAREALKILRRIFPWSVHSPERIGKFSRPCFDYEIGLCPGTCVGSINRTEYMRTIRELKLFFGGKKRQVIAMLTCEMKSASARMEFEKAEQCKRRIFGLQHIQDISLLGGADELRIAGVKEKQRIEGYDISNISGTSAVGSMVVFTGGQPDKNEYRKFRIRTIRQSNDVGMLKEVLRRRFTSSWPLPNLILIDGGKGQVNAAKSVLEEIGLGIPVVGIAKGAKRKKNEFIGVVPKGIDKSVLIRVRDEAHRFAISYHRTLRRRNFIN